MRRLTVVGIGLVVLGMFALLPRAVLSEFVSQDTKVQELGGPGTAAAKNAPAAKAATKPKPPLETTKITPDTVPKSKVVIGPVETRRVYQISLGSWSHQFSVPESVDLLDIADRARGVFGMLAILGVAVFLSEDQSAISGRVVFWGLVLQWGFGLLVLRVPAGIQLVDNAGKAVKSVLDFALEGSEFVFGKPLVDPNGPGQFVFAFRVLPTVIFVAALFAVLYHIGVMQWVVRAFAVVMLRLFGTSGAESLNVAASLFLGQTEAPLTIRPYLSKLTKSELLTVMTAGMAHVSGGVMAAYMAFGVEARHILTAVIMTAPGAILLSKILVPETGKPETLGTVHSAETSSDANVLDAASRGTRDGLHLALNIAAMLISFLALIALVNMGLGQLGELFKFPGLSLQTILGAAMAPAAYMLGVAWEDCRAVGGLLGTRTVLNELIAYKDLGALKSTLIDRSFVIASFALCGFANISSIGIQLGGIGALAPDRRHDLARLGVKALLAGTLANYLSACIAGILL